MRRLYLQRRSMCGVASHVYLRPRSVTGRHNRTRNLPRSHVVTMHHASERLQCTATVCIVPSRASSTFMRSG